MPGGGAGVTHSLSGAFVSLGFHSLVEPFKLERPDAHNVAMFDAQAFQFAVDAERCQPTLEASQRWSLFRSVMATSRSADLPLTTNSRRAREQR